MFTRRAKPIRITGDLLTRVRIRGVLLYSVKNTCHGPTYISVSSRFHPSNHSVTQSRLPVKAVTPECLIAIRHFNTYSTTTPHSSIITSHWGVRCAGQAACITSLVYDLGFLSLIQRLVRRVRTPLKLSSSYSLNINLSCTVTLRGPGSSVGIATDYGLETRWGRDFPPVQTGPGAHPASYKIGTGSFPAIKCGRGVLLTTHPLLVPRSWKSRAILLPTLWATSGL